MIRPLRSYQLVVDLVVAGLFLALALPFEIAVGDPGAVGVVGSIAVVLLFSAALAVRRLAPGPALVLVWVGAVTQMALGRVPGPTDLVVFAVLFTAAAYGSRRVLWIGFASAVAGAFIAVGYLQIVLGARSFSWTLLLGSLVMLAAMLFALVLSWTAGLLLRTAVRARADRAAQRRAELVAVAEQERTEIARDMHDIVAHSLAVVIAQADGARYAGRTDPGTQTEALQTISATARAALADVRVLLAQLRHRQGDAPAPGLSDLEPLFARMRAAGLDLRVDVDRADGVGRVGEGPGADVDVSPAVQRALYRILQEALTNALRHGAGGPVEVHVFWRAESVELEVRNRCIEGARSTPTQAEPQGHGLIGMRERAHLVGGSLDVAVDDADFVVRTRLPTAPA